MWKQTFWFALAGSIVAVLAGAVGHLSIRLDPIDLYDGATSFVSVYVGSQWNELRAVAATGAVLGAVIALATYWSGVRMTTREGNRVALVVSAGLLGVAIGLTPALLLVVDALSGLDEGVSVAVAPSSLLTLYGMSVILAYGAALLGVWLVLRRSNDVHARRTMQCTAVLLPIGAVVATAGGVGAGWLHDFGATPYELVVEILVVALVLSATFAASRSWALSYR